MHDIPITTISWDTDGWTHTQNCLPEMNSRAMKTKVHQTRTAE